MGSGRDSASGVGAGAAVVVSAVSGAESGAQAVNKARRVVVRSKRANGWFIWDSRWDSSFVLEAKYRRSLALILVGRNKRSESQLNPHNSLISHDNQSTLLSIIHS